jgi:hypothetical protein
MDHRGYALSRANREEYSAQEASADALRLAGDGYDSCAYVGFVDGRAQGGINMKLRAGEDSGCRQHRSSRDHRSKGRQNAYRARQPEPLPWLLWSITTGHAHKTSRTPRGQWRLAAPPSQNQRIRNEPNGPLKSTTSVSLRPASQLQTWVAGPGGVTSIRIDRLTRPAAGQPAAPQMRPNSASHPGAPGRKYPLTVDCNPSAYSLESDLCGFLGGIHVR